MRINSNSHDELINSEAKSKKLAAPVLTLRLAHPNYRTHMQNSVTDKPMCDEASQSLVEGEIYEDT
jgi:hypothetical protein